MAGKIPLAFESEGWPHFWRLRRDVDCPMAGRPIRLLVPQGSFREKPPMTAISDPPSRFAVSVGFVGNVAMLALRGEFDILSVAEIDVLLDEMITEGYPLVVMDLADLADVDYMATAGMGVITNAAKRLAALDRKLTVRSPSAKILHLIDATRSGAHVAPFGQRPLMPDVCESNRRS